MKEIVVEEEEEGPVEGVGEKRCKQGALAKGW